MRSHQIHTHQTHSYELNSKQIIRSAGAVNERTLYTTATTATTATVNITSQGSGRSLKIIRNSSSNDAQSIAHCANQCQP